MKTLVLVALVVVGCGGEIPGGSTPDPIVGAWESSQTCAVSFAFDATGEFGEATACTLDAAGSIGVQAEKGTYTDDGDQLVLHTAESTCPGSSKLSTSTYAVEPGKLTLADQSAILILIRASTAPSVSSAATFGCFFAPDGTSMPFAPSPLAPL